MKRDKVKQREGILVSPHERLSESQVKLVDEVSRELLEDPGLICPNKQAVKLFKDAGARIAETDEGPKVSIPSSLIDKSLKTAPSTVVLGARDPDNKLILDAHEPRVRFGSGSETNVWLEVDFDNGKPQFVRKDGSMELLKKAAHLAENLEHLDFFIRCVNMRDDFITVDNKDVNMFSLCLNNIGKHVQAGITNIDRLDDVIKIGEIVAGGKERFEKNPVLSFITCIIKSPFQIVDDTTDKFIEISKRRVPIVISSSPMGGATAPFDEFGMVAQINAELLAGVALNQLVAPEAPILYGAVPVRTRLDNLRDMYGAPEFNHYNIDCAQMARHYGIPCYSTAGVGDASVPGIQATVEKILTLLSVPASGAQYIHYAFGLLERTAVFCPEQAVMDNEHIGLVKYALEDPNVFPEEKEKILKLIRKVMGTRHKAFINYLPLPSKQAVYARYPLEDDENGALGAANTKYKNIMEKQRNNLPAEVQNEIRAKIEDILPETFN